MSGACPPRSGYARGPPAPQPDSRAAPPHSRRIDAASDEATAEKRAQWREGTIVRVIGQMRAFCNKHKAN